jgi:hypothetical protein
MDAQDLPHAGVEDLKVGLEPPMNELPRKIDTERALDELRAGVQSIDDVPPDLLQRLVFLTETSPREFVPHLEALLVEVARRYRTRLTPLYHVVPWSERIIEPAAFREVFQETAKLTEGFAGITARRIAETITRFPRSLMVFRLITGYTSNELSDILLTKLDTTVQPQKLQEIERAEAMDQIPGPPGEEVIAKLGEALFGIVERTLMVLPKDLEPDRFRSRQDKIDTEKGWTSVNRCATQGVSLAELLYERYTGRPFAYVRDALSSQKGDILEDALERLLKDHRIPYDRITDNEAPGFQQAPDYALPHRQEPVVVIESKLAEDGGTARDKASRIERLRHTCDRRGIALMAVVDGKGFRRFNDVLLPIIRNTKGYTYTLETLPAIVDAEPIRRLGPASR